MTTFAEAQALVAEWDEWIGDDDDESVKDWVILLEALRESLIREARLQAMIDAKGNG